MRRGSALFLVWLCTGRLVFAQWVVTTRTNETSSAGALAHVQMTLQNGERRADFEVAVFRERTLTLRLIDNPGGVDLASAMARGSYLAGVNGGYFSPEFKPLGLRLSEGKTVAPMTHARLLTGVLCASRHNIEILRTGEFSARRKVDFALECGPFLVDRAQPLRTLENNRSARRTFAAVGRNGEAALGICRTGLTLAELADALAAMPLGETPIWRALNLDGGSSTAFWFRREEGAPFSVGEFKSVRDFVGVSPQ